MMKAKLLFNSVLFFTASLISMIRAEAVELIISAAFAFLFLTLWIESRKNNTIFQ